MNHCWIVILVYAKVSEPDIQSIFYFIELAKDEVEILSKALIKVGKCYGHVRILRQTVNKIPFEVIDKFHAQMASEMAIQEPQ